MSSSLLELAKLIVPEDDSLLKEIELAITKPKEYFKKFIEQLDEFGINEVESNIAWFALIGGLASRGRLESLDWKEITEDSVYCIDKLFAAATLPPVQWDWVNLEFWQDKLPDRFLKAVNNHLVNSGLLLVYFDIDSDSFPIVLMEAARYPKAERLALEAGYSILDDTTSK